MNYLSIHGTTLLDVIPGKYRIKLDPEDYLLLHFTFTLDHAGANLPQSNLRNILATSGEVLEFKHSRSSGSKSWTRKAGIEIVFAVDKNFIQVPQEEAFTYPKLRIGNAEIVANIGGGCGGGDPYWTDYLGTSCHTCTNIGVRQIKEVAKHAMTIEAAKAAGITISRSTVEDEAFLAESLAQIDGAKTLTSGATVYLQEGYSFRDSRELTFLRWEGKELLCESGPAQIHVKPAKIAWAETAITNKLPVRTPGSLSYNGLNLCAKAA